MTLPNCTPDEWAIRAAELPLAFAQVREDPRLELELLSRLPENPVMVMIASGGETAAQIARSRRVELHLVDVNPAQLALTRLKLFLLSESTPSESRALLGHDILVPSFRRELLERWYDRLGFSLSVFGPVEEVAEWGLDFSGRYERTFVALQRELSRIQTDLVTALSSENETLELRRLLDPATESGHLFESAFRNVMSLQNLVCLFGVDATQNPRQSFADHFAWRTRVCLSRSGRSQNPFLWQLLLGKFPQDFPYDWLRADFSSSVSQVFQPVFHCGRMFEILSTFVDSSVDIVQLSNILDWLSPDAASATLECARRSLRKGGYVVVRQLNSTLSVPALDTGFQWDETLGDCMVESDRSFFYPRIFVGKRR